MLYQCFRAVCSVGSSFTCATAGIAYPLRARALDHEPRGSSRVVSIVLGRVGAARLRLSAPPAGRTLMLYSSVTAY